MSIMTNADEWKVGLQTPRIGAALMAFTRLTLKAKIDMSCACLKPSAFMSPKTEVSPAISL